MGREQAAEIHSQEWLNDEQMRVRRAGLHRRTAGVGVEVLQGAGQGGGIAGEMGACGVGLILAGTRHGKLDQACCNWGYDQHEKCGHTSAFAAVAVSATVSAEEHGETSHAG